MAGRDRAAYGRWRRHERDHAANWQVEDLRVALARTLYRGGVRRVAPRQNASLAHPTARRRGRGARRRADAWRTAGRDDPLDRRLDGEGGGPQRQLSVQRIWRK